ncbi:MAG: single-stranded DNA-binding protein [Cyanobium sp.]
MNHCLLEVEVLEAPQVRYTQDNQTPVAEMTVRLDGLRPDDPPGQLKVVGWGNLAQDLQNRVRVGQRLVLEGRMRMNTITRQDGVKEKRAELTLARLHPLAAGESQPPAGGPVAYAAAPATAIGEPTPSGAAPAVAAGRPPVPGPQRRQVPSPGAGAVAAPPQAAPAPAVWNTAPLVPPDEFADDDDIPF